MSGADNKTTEAELYAACRQDVLAVHPSAREIVKGLSSVAIMALGGTDTAVCDELLGAGSNADRAWADAYGRMTGQL